MTVLEKKINCHPLTCLPSEIEGSGHFNTRDYMAREKTFPPSRKGFFEIYPRKRGNWGLFLKTIAICHAGLQA